MFQTVMIIAGEIFFRNFSDGIIVLHLLENYGLFKNIRQAQN